MIFCLISSMVIILCMILRVLVKFNILSHMAGLFLLKYRKMLRMAITVRNCIKLPRNIKLYLIMYAMIVLMPKILINLEINTIKCCTLSLRQLTMEFGWPKMQILWRVYREISPGRWYLLNLKHNCACVLQMWLKETQYSFISVRNRKIKLEIRS